MVESSLRGKGAEIKSSDGIFINAGFQAFQLLADELTSHGHDRPHAMDVSFHIILDLILIEFLAPLAGIRGGWLNTAVKCWENRDILPGHMKKPLFQFIFHPLNEHHEATFESDLDHFQIKGNELNVSHSWEADGCVNDETWVSISKLMSTFSYTPSITLAEKDGTVVNPAKLDSLIETITVATMNQARSVTAGTVFTHHVEARFICKVALSSWLHGHCVSIDAGTIDNIIFHPELGTVNNLPKERRQEMQAALENVRMLDPACGTGVFLVEFAECMTRIMDHLNLVADPWKIIQRTIHGVDSNEWAIAGTYIRLWTWYLHGRGDHEANLDHKIVLPDCTGILMHGDFLDIIGPVHDQNFDIIIGNPPYVRQEDINEPWTVLKADLKDRDDARATYKQRIAGTIPKMFPGQNVNLMSDYFVYFLYKATFLSPGAGVICFITSSSWLTTKYGLSLQSFLLSHGRLVSVFDYSCRSFAQAEINTTIILFEKDPPDVHEDQTGRRSITRFVQIKGASLPVSVQQPTKQEQGVRRGTDLETLVQNVEETDDIKVISIHHDDLKNIVQGFHAPRKMDQAKVNMSGKWLGAFLSAPSIFYDVMSRAKDKLVSLGTLARIQAGCYTGNNSFFYVNDQVIENFTLEHEYIKPIIRSSKDIRNLTLKREHAWTTRVLSIPDVPVDQLERAGYPGIASYIEWGEKQFTKGGQKTRAGIPWPKVQTVRNRKYWYAIPPSNLVETCQFMQYISHDRFYCPHSVQPVASDRCFHRIFPLPSIDGLALHAALNSTLTAFTIMVLGRTNLGAGALKIEALDAISIPILDVRVLDEGLTRDLRARIEKLANRAPRSLVDECGGPVQPARGISGRVHEPLADRKALDGLIFDVLGVNENQRDAIYTATSELVLKRLKKAKQFTKTNESSKLVI
nr:Eco57I restriction-modification methylase domain-containing protein [Candidatus Sigynarchaeota archaeon]